MLNAHQMRQIAVAARLGEHTTAGIDEDNRQISGRCRSDHIARVLLVARRIGDDVFTCASRKIAISHVDGNTLLAFSLQAIGKQR